MGSELLLTGAKMHQPASISQDCKICNVLKDPSRLCACFHQDRTDLELLGFPLNGAEPEARFQSSPATKGKADRVIEASSEEEGASGKAKAPKAPNIHTSKYSFIAWLHAHASMAAITAKAHSERKTLRGGPSPPAQNQHDPPGLSFS